MRELHAEGDQLPQLQPDEEHRPRSRSVATATSCRARPPGASAPPTCWRQTTVVPHQPGRRDRRPDHEGQAVVLRGLGPTTKNSSGRDATSSTTRSRRSAASSGRAGRTSSTTTSRRSSPATCASGSPGPTRRNMNRGGAPVFQPDNDPLGFRTTRTSPGSRGHAMKGYTTTALPLVNGQLDQETFDPHLRDERRRLPGTTPTPATWTGWCRRQSSSTGRRATSIYSNTTPPEVRFNDIRYIYNQTPCGCSTCRRATPDHRLVSTPAHVGRHRDTGDTRRLALPAGYGLLQKAGYEICAPIAHISCIIVNHE